MRHAKLRSFIRFAPAAVLSRAASITAEQAHKARFAQNRRDIPKEKAPGPWCHYLMTTAYGIPTDTGDFPVSFNPYIELAAEHPINTNCRNCHLRAAWPPGNRDLGQKRSSSYLVEPEPGPMADLKPDDPVFEGLMLMDIQWSMVNRAIPVPGGEESVEASE